MAGLTCARRAHTAVHRPLSTDVFDIDGENVQALRRPDAHPRSAVSEPTLVRDLATACRQGWSQSATQADPLAGNPRPPGIPSTGEGCSSRAGHVYMASAYAGMERRDTTASTSRQPRAPGRETRFNDKRRTGRPSSARLWKCTSRISSAFRSPRRRLGAAWPLPFSMSRMGHRARPSYRCVGWVFTVDSGAYRRIGSDRISARHRYTSISSGTTPRQPGNFHRA